MYIKVTTIMSCILVKLLVIKSNLIYNNSMVKIIRGKYKNLRLQVNYNGDIIIKAPKIISQSRIIEFINSKQNWINKQLKKIEDINNLKAKYNFNKYVYHYGIAEEIKEPKKKFYETTFKKEVVPLVISLSKKYNINIKSINITNTKRVWGSLNLKNEMKLNWKLIILPMDLVEYIIIHELCHTIEFNHSKAFWIQVKNKVGDYRNRKEKLDKYGFLLRENIL